MSDLLKINVNEHTEKKGQLTYLSWAWAWAEVLKVDPSAEWEAIEYDNPDGTKGPCMWIGDTAMVKTKVTILGKTKTCQLAVMDNRNNAVKNPDARKISDAIMRCMTKAISMHGLGLYIYAGEDLPEGEEPPPEDLAKGGSVRHAVRDGIGEDLPQDWKDYLQGFAGDLADLVKRGNASEAAQKIALDKLDSEQRTYLENQMDSKTRAAIKRAEQEIRQAFNTREKAPA